MTEVVDPAGEFVVRRSRRRQLPNLLVVLAFLVGVVAAGVTGLETGWLTAVGITVFMVVLGIGLVDLARSGPGSTALLRLSPTGVEVPEVATVPWSDLADVRLIPIRWPRGYSLVAFLPRSGVTLPTIPRSRLTSGAMRGTSAALTARSGSPLVLLPQPTTATAHEVLAAVTRLRGAVGDPR